MDPRLLAYFNQELVYLRSAAVEYGRDHDEVSTRLKLKAQGDFDPYVERLLEGVAFLGARVQLKMADQFPEFTHHLLQAMQPHYLAPMPSICVAGFEPRLDDPILIEGHDVRRGTQLTAMASAHQDAPVKFLTGHDVKLWPLVISEVEYLPNSTATSEYAKHAGLPTAAAGLRLRFTAAPKAELHQLAIQALPLYLAGSQAIPYELYRQIIGDTVGVVARSPDTVSGEWTRLPLPGQVGFADEEALLPAEERSFRGYRLLSEYFACPERFLFVDLKELQRAFSKCERSCDVILLFRRSAPMLAGAIGKDNFRLFATPAINLFEMRLDRVKIEPHTHEHQAIPDKTRKLNYEVFRIADVRAVSRENVEQRPVAPLYALGAQLYDRREAIFYTTRLKLRRLSTRERRARDRGEYIGTETWLSLTAPGDPELLADIAALEVTALVTNRELPELLTFRGTSHFAAIGIPAREISVLRAPSRPRSPPGIGTEIGEGDAAWRLIGHLSPNYLTLAPEDHDRPTVLRDHLALYRPPDDDALAQEIDGIESIQSRKVTRRVPGLDQMATARGHHITIRLNHSAFDRGRMFLFSAVIERFLAEFASINSFTQTEFHSSKEGKFAQWPPRMGRRHSI